MGDRSLRHLAYDKIRAAIESGQIPKGTATSEGELGRMLDMSRTPVRAALQRLELEGYVRIVSKHGVLILDSSSERVGNLLDIIGASALFSYSVTWIADREKLLEAAAAKQEQFRALMEKPPEVPNTLTDFEFRLLDDLIALNPNDEMSQAFRSTASRLFWNRNIRRWQAPYVGETTESVRKLLESLGDGTEAFTNTLLPYLRMLKRTWL